MAFDYSKLRGRIKEKCGSQQRFSRLIGKSETAVSGRLNNVTDFSQEEILAACAVLEIPLTEMSIYFFTPKVQKREPQEPV